MSKLTYLHKVMNQSLKDGEVTTYEEEIIDGPKGITVKLYSKSNGVMERIRISGKDDKYVMKVTEGDKTEETHLNKKELMEELKKNKKLKFAADFAKTQKGGSWLNRAGSSKKGSKSSKKGSMKSMGSKKAPKKGSKKGSKRGSKGKKRGSK
jgi:hypothetical protein